jgi:hypothetical protein
VTVLSVAVVPPKEEHGEINEAGFLPSDQYWHAEIKDLRTNSSNNSQSPEVRKVCFCLMHCASNCTGVGQRTVVLASRRFSREWLHQKGLKETVITIFCRRPDADS